MNAQGKPNRGVGRAWLAAALMLGVGLALVWAQPLQFELERTLEPQLEHVFSVAISPDGELIASAGAFPPGRCGFQAGRYQITVWRLHDGEVVQRWPGHGCWTDAIAFSPDGRLLASGGGFQGPAPGSADYLDPTDGAVRIWEMASGRLLHNLKVHSEPVRTVAFSPDGKLLASSGDDRVIHLWEIGSTRPSMTLRGHTGIVRAVVFSPDGALLASSGADGIVRIWQVEDGAQIKRLQAGPTGVFARGHALAFSPDGQLLASDSGERAWSMKIWRVEDGAELLELDHERPVRSAVFSPDGEFLITGGGVLEPFGTPFGEVRIWRVADGMEVQRLEGHGRQVTSVVSSPDGTRIASGSIGGTVRIWRRVSAKE